MCQPLSYPLGNVTLEWIDNVKLNQLVSRLPALYYSALEPKGPSYYLKGKIGRGKTTTFEQFPTDHERH